MILPLGMLKPLQMPRSQKIGLGFLFLIVSIEAAFDILRSAFTLNGYLNKYPDAGVVWDLCQPTLAAILCTLPSYRGLLGRKTGKENRRMMHAGGHDPERSGDMIGLRRNIEMDDMNAYSLHSRDERAHSLT